MKHILGFEPGTCTVQAQMDLLFPSAGETDSSVDAEESATSRKKDRIRADLQHLLPRGTFGKASINLQA